MFLQSKSDFKIWLVLILLNISIKANGHISKTIFLDTPDTLENVIIQTDTIFTTDTTRVTIYDTIYEDIPKTPEITSKFSLDYSVASGVALNSNYFTRSPEYENQVKALNESQKGLWMFFSGLSLTVNFKKWFIEGGVAYGQYRSGFNYKNIQQTIVSKTIKTPVIVDSYVQLPDSVWVNVMDTIVSTTRDTTTDISNHKTLNRFQYLEIPFALGYNFKLNQRYTLFVSGGILTCVLINAKGKTYSSQNEVVDLRKQDVSNFVFSFVGSVGINYKISKSFSLATRVSYQANLSSVYKRKSMINDKQSFLNIALGLRYNF
jgi:hypothetical protein